MKSHLRLAAALPLLALPAAASSPVTASYTADGRMNFPADYRQWVYLTSGQGMSYNPVAQAQPTAPYDNVFVNRDAYQAFLDTGHWPDGTVLVLEIRGATGKGSINKAGSFQTGEPLGVEVHVKDDKRFGPSQDGWAFFGFDPAKPEPAEKVPETAACYSCHHDHAAVDRTFVQFYPTLLPVAKAMGTFSAGYLKDEAEAAAAAKAP